MSFLNKFINDGATKVFVSPFYNWAELYNVPDKPNQFFICLTFSAIFLMLTLLGLCWPEKIKRITSPVLCWTEKIKKVTSRFFMPVIESLLALMAAGTLLFYFIPLIWGDVRLLNDNFLLQEQTKLKGGIVQNVAFLRAHSLGGFKLSQPTQGLPITLKQERIFQFSLLSSAPELLQWIEKHANKQLHFDPTSREVSFIGNVSQEMYMSLEGLLQDKRDVSTLRRKYRDYTNGNYGIQTAEEVEFNKKNSLEFEWKILNRWALHHHGFIFNSINEFRLGKPISTINFQYGFVNTIGFYGLTRLLGGFNLQNYFKVSFAFYPIYIFILAFVAWVIFRQKQYVYLLVILVVASVLFLDFEKILRAPGINPVRHFFDLWVLGFMVLYWQTRKVKFLWLGYFFVFFQVLCNREFGLFLLGASFSAQLIDIKETGISTQKKQLVYSAILVIAILTGLYFLKDISNYMSAYYSKGFLSFMFKSASLRNWLIYFGVFYFSVVFIPSHRTGHLKKTLLFLIVYLNGFFFYYLWGNTKNHLLVMVPIAALLVLVFGKTISLCLKEKNGAIDSRPVFAGGVLEKKVLFLLICGCFIGYFCKALPTFRKVKKEFDENFKNHQVHSWNFKTATLKSTIDPLQLQQAVSLIHHYSPSSKGIYIISTLDNILPMLSERYSAMPFNDLAFYLLTPKESGMAIDTINRDKPKYLFVEHGILNDRSGEICNEKDGPRIESILRVMRLDVFTAVFKAVSKDYKKVSPGEIIDVYERLTGI